MTRRKIVVAAIIVAVCGIGGWFAASRLPPHKHELVQKTDEQGKVYYTCPMHPQVQKDEPGQCPICGMQLQKAELAPESAEREVLYWHDPMKPEVHFDKPGKSPFMDMQLVPKYADGAGEGTVSVDSRSIQNLGIRTAPVERSSFSSSLSAVGAVEVDERAVYAIESRAGGWVEQLAVRAVGDPVRKGQRVAGIYSPDLYAAQQEFVLAARSNDTLLKDASRQRLLGLGVSAGQIDAIASSGQAQRLAGIISPADGIVTELNVRQGEQVMPGTPLMRIANLSRVWVTVEVPEVQAAVLRSGRGAEAMLQGLPGKTFTGTVDYVYPRLDAQTRTVRARIVFANPRLELKPGMFATVQLAGGKEQSALSIPSEAVIRTGERTVVIVAEGEGRFRPAPVTTGAEHDGRTEVLSGLEAGDEVVISGQFLIDSEASLQGVISRMAPAAEPME